MTVLKKSPQILSVLMRHQDIRAVALIDQKGTVHDQKGSAECLRIGANDPTIIISKEADPSPKESVYIRSFAGERFLLVVFNENVDFDAIKTDVDETVRVHA